MVKKEFRKFRSSLDVYKTAQLHAASNLSNLPQIKWLHDLNQKDNFLKAVNDIIEYKTKYSPRESARNLTGTGRLCVRSKDIQIPKDVATERAYAGMFHFIQYIRTSRFKGTRSKVREMLESRVLYIADWIRYLKQRNAKAAGYEIICGNEITTNERTEWSSLELTSNTEAILDGGLDPEKWIAKNKRCFDSAIEAWPGLKIKVHYP